MKRGKFPLPRVLGVGGKNIWLESEVDAWLSALPLREYAKPRDE
jgi:predicted DNA-binding transcriptional regulator AlpA